MLNLINCLLTGERLLSSGGWENVNKSSIRNAFGFNQLQSKKERNVSIENSASSDLFWAPIKKL